MYGEGLGAILVESIAFCLTFASHDSSITLPDDGNTFGAKRWEEFPSLDAILEALRLQCVLPKKVTAYSMPFFAAVVSVTYSKQD